MLFFFSFFFCTRTKRNNSLDICVFPFFGALRVPILLLTTSSHFVFNCCLVLLLPFLSVTSRHNPLTASLIAFAVVRVAFATTNWFTTANWYSPFVAFFFFSSPTCRPKDSGVFARFSFWRCGYNSVTRPFLLLLSLQSSSITHISSSSSSFYLVIVAWPSYRHAIDDGRRHQQQQQHAKVSTVQDWK